MPKQIAGTVYWIENGKQTTRVADVKEAFSDPDQAKAQILYAERSGDKRQLRLSRLAFRQFQGKRYRVESKAAIGKKPSAKGNLKLKPLRNTATTRRGKRTSAGKVVKRKASKK